MGNQPSTLLSFLSTVSNVGKVYTLNWLWNEQLDMNFSYNAEQKDDGLKWIKTTLDTI